MISSEKHYPKFGVTPNRITITGKNYQKCKGVITRVKVAVKVSASTDWVSRSGVLFFDLENNYMKVLELLGYIFTM